jgi:hypothetical protein
MDDNTTKVVLIAIVLAFVVALIRRFDRISLRIERLKIDIFGLLKIGASLLDITMQGRRRRKRRRLNQSGDVAWPPPRLHCSFAFADGITIVPGNHDIDVFIVTHPDEDHLHALRDFFRCPHHGSR